MWQRDYTTLAGCKGASPAFSPVLATVGLTAPEHFGPLVVARDSEHAPAVFKIAGGLRWPLGVIANRFLKVFRHGVSPNGAEVWAA